MQHVERMPSHERLKQARRRRVIQLKRWNEYDKECNQALAAATAAAANANSSSSLTSTSQRSTLASLVSSSLLPLSSSSSLYKTK